MKHCSRFLIGIGSGLGLCVGPIYLAEIAPSSIRGAVGQSAFITDVVPIFNRGALGILTQLAVVFGIMLTQVAGITLATPATWRFVFFLSFIVSVLQLLFSSMIVESPVWLFNQNRLEEHKRAVTRLWGNVACKTTYYIISNCYTHPSSYQAEEPLLNQIEQTREVLPQDNLTIFQVYATSGLRKPLMIVTLVMLSQQLSGK